MEYRDAKIFFPSHRLDGKVVVQAVWMCGRPWAMVPQEAEGVFRGVDAT